MICPYQGQSICVSPSICPRCESGFDMSEDWKVYENLEDFKEFFCDWIDSIVEEGYTDDSKILAMKRDGSIFFNFRDIILRHPENETIQDLFIEIKNMEPPE